jgi:hypothetical protein
MIPLEVTVNNIQVILVCGRPGDRGRGGRGTDSETPAASESAPGAL